MKKLFLLSTIFFFIGLVNITNAESTILLKDASEFNKNNPQPILNENRNNFALLLYKGDFDLDEGKGISLYSSGKATELPKEFTIIGERVLSNNGSSIILSDDYPDSIFYQNSKAFKCASEIIDKKNGKIACLFLFDNNKDPEVLVNGQKIGQFVDYDASDFSNSSKYFAFSPNGKDYAFVQKIFNPEYKKKIEELDTRERMILDGAGSGDVDQTKKRAEELLKIDKEKQQVEDSFKKTWKFKNQIIVNGKIKKEYRQIYAVTFTDDGILAYLAEDGGKKILYIGDKKNDLSSYKWSADLKDDSVVVDFIISPDKKRHFISFRKDSFSMISILDGKQISNDNYFMVGGIFSSNSKHVCYRGLSNAGEFIGCDNGKQQLFKAVEKVEFLKRNDGNIYFTEYVAGNEKSDVCLFKNNIKQVCNKDLLGVWQVSQDGKNYSGVKAIDSADGRTRYLYYILNKKEFGPYKYVNDNSGNHDYYDYTGDYLINPKGQMVYCFNGDLHIDGKIKTKGACTQGTFVAKGGTELWKFYIDNKNQLIWDRTVIK